MDSPAHRARLRFPLLSSLTAAEALAPHPLTLSPTLSVAEAAAKIEHIPFAGATVVDGTGALIGVFTRGDVRSASEAAHAQTTVGQVMNQQPETTFLTQTLDVALETLTTQHVRWLAVLAERQSNKLAGILTVADVVRTYRSALNNVVRGVSGLATGLTMLDLVVNAASAVSNHSLAELHLMPETLILSVRREDAIIVPTASTKLLPGDVVAVLTSATDHGAVHRLFETPVAATP